MARTISAKCGNILPAYMQIMSSRGFPLKKRKSLFMNSFAWGDVSVPLPHNFCVSAQWTAAALYLWFVFLFSSCKWKLAIRTADLNVLRQEDLSFVPMKLTEISFMWWVFLLGFTVPGCLGLIYLVHFVKKRTFIPMPFPEFYLADQQSWCNEDTWWQ